ncbi:MAG: cytochrome c [Helicobacteraceae bacterium]|nr:cytochrome c [Helicobacteraceae bacterium]
MRFFSILILLSLSIFAQTPYEKGKDLYMEKTCYSCHGPKAEGMHNYPYLANRAKGFLEYKLKRFRDKKADNQQQEMMVAYAVGLSDEEIENLVTFLYEYKDEEQQERYDDSYRVHGDGGS